MPLKPYVDLHVHSCFSDGSMTPEEIVVAAQENGVGVLAIADHDALEGSLLLSSLGRRNGIYTIPSVEIDALDNGENIHILAYGYDERDQAFREFVRNVRFMLDESGVRLIEAMQKEHPVVSIADYMAFSYDARLGGWKALHYLLHKNITRHLKEGVAYYARYGVTYDRSGYPSVSSACRRIHMAGGYAVLAHPGETIDTRNIGYFTATLARFASYGLDGLECYYPTHEDAVTQACVDFCASRGMMITSGSDCHGIFARFQVGETKVSLYDLALRDLVR